MSVKINKASIIFLLILGFITTPKAQSVQLFPVNTKSSLRGLSVVTDSIVWVSGSNGMVGTSLNGGNTWTWHQVKGYETRQFRDIEAFDASHAIIMGIDSPGIILITSDGGLYWEETLKDTTHGVFFDAMDFWDQNNGVLIGDPVNGKFLLYRTNDGGRHWQKVPIEYCPSADTGEACFASSGTNIKMINKEDYIFVSGGKTSNFYSKSKIVALPIVQGKESTGANSIAIKNKKTYVVAGGDFQKKDESQSCIAISHNKGKSWHQPITSISGYRSCIEFLDDDQWLTCGLNGVDISVDNGNNFKKISNQSFHVCKKAKHGTAVYFAGNNVIGKLLN